MAKGRRIVPRTPAVDEVGNQLFGSALRLKVAMWLVSRAEPLFYADEFAKDTGHYSTGTAKVILRFVKLGMAQKLDVVTPGTTAGRCVYYKRLEHPLWDVVRAAAGALEGSSKARQPSAKALARARERLLELELELR